MPVISYQFLSTIESLAAAAGNWQLATGNYLLANFVNPAFFVAGLALMAIPIIIHILNRRRFKTVSWAAMEFLLRAMRRNRRRLRFEQWVLLSVRCLVLGLLGLALARPMGCQETTLATLAGQRAGLHVIVIDNSYSMAYEANRQNARTHLDQGKTIAKELIDRLSSGGESVALITASRPAAGVLVPATYDLQAARDAIDRIEQSYGGTDLTGAMQLAVRVAQEHDTMPLRSLHLITDGTASAFLPSRQGSGEPLAEAGKAAGQLFRVAHYNLHQEGQWNAAAVELRPASNLVRAKFNNDFLGTFRAFGNATEGHLQWRFDNQTIPGGGRVALQADSQPITQSQVQIARGGPHVLAATVSAEDRLRVDDTRWSVVNVASELKVLIVEGERGIGALSGSAAFLELALAPPAEAGGPVGATNRSASYVAPERISDLELGNKVLGDYRAVILCGVGQIQPAQADQLAAFVRQGGTLMLFMGEQVSANNYNQMFLPRKLLPGPLTKRVSITGDQRGFLFDFQPHGLLHPYLRVFQGEEKSGLDTALVFTYWQADVPADAPVERVLNYIHTGEDGRNDPAITAHGLGSGRVIFISTTANDEWQSFCAKPSYLVLMHELLSGSVNAGDRWMNLLVGERLEIPSVLQLTTIPTLTDPQQGQIVLEQSGEPGQPLIYRSPPLRQPGLYTLSTGAATYPIAVNVPGDEADISRVGDDAVRKALGGIDLEMHADQLPLEAVADRGGKDFGWSIMLLVLALVGMECFLAMRFGHYRRQVSTGGSAHVD